MKNSALLIIVFLSISGAFSLQTVSARTAGPVPSPIKIIGNLRLCISQTPTAVVPHFMTCDLYVARGGSALDGLNITIDKVKMVHEAYAQPGSYHCEPNQYLAVSGSTLRLEIRPPKGLPSTTPPVFGGSDPIVSATADIGAVIMITQPAGDVVNINAANLAVPTMVKKTVGFAWSGGVAPYTLALLRNPTTSPLNFYTQSAVMTNSYGVPVGMFSNGQLYSVHISCTFAPFRFGSRRGIVIDPSSQITVGVSAMKNFTVNITK